MAASATQSQTTPPGDGLRRFIAAGAFVTLAIGLAALAASLLPYHTALDYLGMLVRHADEKHIRPAFYAMLARSLRWGGISLVVAGAVGWFSAERVGAELAQSSRAAWLELRNGAAEALVFLRGQTVFHRIALAAAVGTGIAIRAWYLFVQPMRYDEACTYLRYVKVGLLRGFVVDYTPNNHLLNTLAIFVVTHLAGPAPPVIRIPAFLAGCATILLTYYAAAIWWGSSAGVVAAALVAANAELISFSSNARGYALIGALFLLQIIFASALGKAPDRRGLWTLFAVSSIAAILTVPTGVYLLAAASGLYLVIAWKGKHDLGLTLRPLLASGAVIVAACALVYWPVILGSGYDALFSNRYIEPETPAQYLTRLPGAVSDLWFQWNTGWAAWFMLVVGAGAALGMARFGRGPAVFAVGVLVCVLVTAIQRVTPPGRVFLFLLPVYLATAAAGLSEAARWISLRRSSLAGSLAAFVLLILGVAQTASSGAVLLLPETGTNNDAPNAAAFMAAQIRPSDLVMATLPASYPVRYYLMRRGVSETLWGVGGRMIDRVIVFVDKKAPTVSPTQLHDSLTQAFQQSYTGVDPNAFGQGQVLYESSKLEALALPKAAY